MTNYIVPQTTPTLSNELKQKRKALQLKLSEIETAENILTEHPEVEALFDIVAKVRRPLTRK